MEGHHNNSYCFLTALLTLTVVLLSFEAVITCSALRFDPSVRTPTQFIRTSCAKTKFPKLCCHSLSSYADTIQTSPMQLAHAALNVSLSSAEYTSAAVKRLSTGRRSKDPREEAAISDCMENIGDSVDELQQSLEVMRHLRGKNLRIKMDDIQTWVSAALTGENTCLDSIDAIAAKGDVSFTGTLKRQILQVVQLTSNALSLTNGLAGVESVSP